MMHRLIKDKRFLLPSEVKKYALGSKQKVKEYIEANGGHIIKDKYEPEEFDYILIGTPIKDFGFSASRHLKLYPEAKILFEQELLNEPKAESNYLKSLFQDYMDRFRDIFSHYDILVAYYSIGKPYTSEDFKRIEKKYRKNIPAAIKEFYSVFGKIKLIWTYCSINTKRSFYDEKDVDNLISSTCGEMFGSIQILDLNKVLSEDWTKYEHAVHLSSGKELKIFDYHSDENMAAFDLENDNPLVYMGDDHGATFEDYKPMLFSDYLKLTINSYGFFRRKYLFESAYGTQKKLSGFSEILERPIELVPVRLDDIE
ncbi:SMI1/KNR4 family protein [Chryseobacterium gambrini]|uniref:SMI1/KNR4 family protein n=2 Tax=Chryseobacterium gambrini TaxID=373672 RepID=A0ABN7CDJ6_9FLAO|nr:SMI1/KNR4 family protein [Chryseobacterium gambrini]